MNEEQEKWWARLLLEREVVKPEQAVICSFFERLVDGKPCKDWLCEVYPTSITCSRGRIKIGAFNDVDVFDYVDEIQVDGFVVYWYSDSKRDERGNEYVCYNWGEDATWRAFGAALNRFVELYHREISRGIIGKYYLEDDYDPSRVLVTTVYNYMDQKEE